MQISFLNPGFFILLALIPVFWLVPRILLGGKSTNKVQGVLRSLLLVLIVAALAKPVLLSSDPELYQVFVVDRSESLSAEQRAESDQVLAELVGKVTNKDKVSVIALGNDNSELDADQYGNRLRIYGESRSSLSAALAAAGQQIPEGASGAVTVISDGLATDRRWGPAIQALVERGMPVNTYDLGVNLDDVYPAAIHIDGQLRAGQTVRVSVDVIGEADAFQVKLLGGQGEEIAVSQPALSEDRATVVLEFEAERAGFLPLTAEVIVQGRDADAGNNRLTRTLAIQEPLKALYIGERMQQGAAKLSDLLGSGFEVVDGAGQALDGNFEFAGYEAVIIDDAPARNLTEGFQKKLKEAVANDGLGLVYAGGEAAFGGGGYDKTEIADVLPIEFKQKNEKKDPSTALAIIVDSSGSMSGTRIDLAKQIARLAVRKLQPHDRIGIVEFYGAKHWAIPMQPAANKIEIDRAIGRIQATGGTIMLPAIEEAYYGLKNIDTRYKHIVAITDAGIENADYEGLARRIAKDGINLSTILVGPEVHNVIMNNIANWGKGRFYSVADRMNLVELILKQPIDNKMPAYKSGSFSLASRTGKGWWGDVDRNAIPALDGYVETRTRPGAEVLLEVEESGHPVLSSWHYGLGRVTTLMTEPVGPGTQSWQAWQDYGRLLARVISRTADDGEAFGYQLDRNDYQLTVRARRFSGDDSLQPQLSRLSNGRVDGELQFERLSPDLYQAKLLIAPAVDVQLQSDDNRRLVSNVLDDYAPETQVDPEQGINLTELANVTGGTALESGDELVVTQSGSESQSALSLSKLWHWLILLALLVYISELVYRRWPKQS